MRGPEAKTLSAVEGGNAGVSMSPLLRICDVLPVQKAGPRLGPG